MIFAEHSPFFYLNTHSSLLHAYYYKFRKISQINYYYFIIDVNQGSQTRGPPDAFVRPANIQKNDKIIKFDQI